MVKEGISKVDLLTFVKSPSAFKLWLKDNAVVDVSNVNATLGVLNTGLSFVNSAVLNGENSELIYLIHDWVIQITDIFVDLPNFEGKHDVLHLCARLVLILEQRYYVEWLEFRKACCEFEDLENYRIYKVLLKIISNSTYLPRTTNLGGIALAYFFHTFPSCFQSIQIFLINDLTVKVKDEKKFQSENLAFDLGHICVLHGLFMCGKNDILLSQYQILGKPFVLALLPLVVQFCHDKKVNAYHCFTTLLAWLKYMKKNCAGLHTLLASGVPIFGIESSNLSLVLNVLDLNWTNSCDGVVGLVTQCFSELIELHLEESKYVSNDENIVKYLFAKIMEETWTIKNKYLKLGIVIKHVDLAQIFLEYPQFLEDLCLSTGSNLLASASSDIYHVLITKFYQENINETEEDLINMWSSKFLPTLKSGLCSQNCIVRKNVARYYLVYTLKILPFTFHHLRVTFESMDTNEGYLTLATIFHLSRKEGICTLEDLNTNSLSACINHSDESVRLEIFALLCTSIKKAERISTLEINFLKPFISNNLNIDDAAFRQLMLAHFKVLMIRLRDSCLFMFKLLKNNSSKETELSESTDFLEWVIELVLSNLNYGGCYQRRQMCLQMLHSLLNTWCLVKPNKSRKEFVPEATPKFIKYLESRGKWKLQSPRVLRTLMICVVDYMDESKQLALIIIKEFFIKDLAANDENLNGIAQILCSSPKTMHCDSGAVLFLLSYLKCSTFKSQYQYVEDLLVLLEKQFKISKSNMLLASTKAPVHGILAALIKIFREISQNPNNPEVYNWAPLVSNAINIACCIIFYILNILAGKSNNDKTPSFADIDKAIEDLSLSSNFDSAKESKLAEDSQLILACCWLMLKNSCLMLGEMVKIFPLENNRSEKKYVISHAQVMQLGDVLSTVLLQCRHRGVIESSCLGFEMFCQKLLLSGDVYYEMVSNMLKKSLETAVHDASSTSVTRRSAGFPVYITAIVTSEIYGEKKLLQHSLNVLLEIASLKKDENLELDQINDIVDLPQTRALHILKELVHDSRCSLNIFYKLDEILLICLKRFDSLSWAIRNAAIQLYGTVVSRLLGQKKVSDDNSNYNSMSIEEFFLSWPSLQQFFEDQLDCNASQPPKSIIIPLLSLLGHLVPSNSASNLCEQFRQRIIPYLKCQNWHIRQLAAQALTASLSVYNIKEHVNFLTTNSNKKLSWNEVHGNLHCLNLTLYSIKQWPKFNITCIWNDIKEFCIDLLKDARSPLVVQVLAIEVLHHNSDSDIQFAFYNSLHEKQKKEYFPGNSLINQRLYYWKLKTAWKSIDIHELTSLTFNNDEIDALVNFLTNDLNSYKCGENLEKWNQVQILLISLCEKAPKIKYLTLLQTIISIYEIAEIIEDEVISKRIANLCRRLISEDESSIFVSAAVIAVWAIALKASPRNNVTYKSDVETWSTLVLKNTSPRLNENCRLFATKALAIAGAEVMSTLLTSEETSFRYIIITRLLDSTFNLLQDEHTEIRKEATQFICRLAKQSKPSLKLNKSIHANVAIVILSQYISDNLFQVDEVIDYMWEKIGGSTNLTAIDQQLLSSDSKVTLFEQEEINVYAEKCFISQVYGKTLTNLLQKRNVQQNVDWANSKLDKTLREAQYLEMKWMPSATCLEVGLQTKILPHLVNLYRQLVIFSEIDDTRWLENNRIAHYLEKLKTLLNF